MPSANPTTPVSKAFRSAEGAGILKAYNVHPNGALSGVTTALEISPGKETLVVAEIAGDKILALR